MQCAARRGPRASLTVAPLWSRVDDTPGCLCFCAARLLIPHDVFLTNTLDAELITSGRSPYPPWATGAPAPHQMLWTLLGLSLNALLVAASCVCVRRLRSVEKSASRKKKVQMEARMRHFGRGML